jgi:aminoglycoside phosphotransferase (APT) family kinase protein
MTRDESPSQRQVGAGVVGPLSEWLADKLEVAAVEIRDLRRHSEGFSWITYTLTAHWNDTSTGIATSRGFAVRREPEDGVLAPYDIYQQYRLHEIVRGASGVPVPELYWLELDPAVLGMPFYVMERLEGQVPTPDEDQPFGPSDRAALGEQFVENLSRLHRIDWRTLRLDGLLDVPGSAEESARRQIDHWMELYESSILTEIPAVRKAEGWLRSNLSTSGRLALCHGDYRSGNYMIRGGSIVGIFDWELAHISDPLDDVAWTMMPAFRGRSGLVAHLLSDEEFVDRYQRSSGISVDPRALKFWRVLNYVKAVAIFCRGCHAFEQGRANDLRMATFGYRLLYLLRQVLADLAEEKS